MVHWVNGLSTTALNAMTTLPFSPPLNPGTYFSAYTSCHAETSPSKMRMTPVAIAVQTHRKSTVRGKGWCFHREPAPSTSPAFSRTVVGATLPMAEYTVLLEQARTGVNARQPGRATAYYLWIGWYGEVTTHRYGEQTASITGRWHFTILCRDRARAPAVATSKRSRIWATG